MLLQVNLNWDNNNKNVIICGNLLKPSKKANAPQKT